MCVCVCLDTHIYLYISVSTYRLIRASSLHVYIRRILRFGVRGRPSAGQVKGFRGFCLCSRARALRFASVRVGPARASTHVQPAAPRGERRVRRVDLCLRRSRKVPAAVRGVLTRYSGSSPRGTRSTHTQALRPHRSLLVSLEQRPIPLRVPCEYPSDYPCE